MNFLHELLEAFSTLSGRTSADQTHSTSQGPVCIGHSCYADILKAPLIAEFILLKYAMPAPSSVSSPVKCWLSIKLCLPIFLPKHLRLWNNLLCGTHLLTWFQAVILFSEGKGGGSLYTFMKANETSIPHRTKNNSGPMWCGRICLIYPVFFKHTCTIFARIAFISHGLQSSYFQAASDLTKADVKLPYQEIWAHQHTTLFSCI